MSQNTDKKTKTGNEENNEVKIFGAPGSTLQTPEEHQHDQSIDPTKDATMEVSNDDLRETDTDRYRAKIDGESSDTSKDL